MQKTIQSPEIVIFVYNKMMKDIKVNAQTIHASHNSKEQDILVAMDIVGMNGC